MTYIISKMADDHMEVIPPSDNENDENEFWKWIWIASSSKWT